MASRRARRVAVVSHLNFALERLQKTCRLVEYLYIESMVRPFDMLRVDAAVGERSRTAPQVPMTLSLDLYLLPRL